MSSNRYTVDISCVMLDKRWENLENIYQGHRNRDDACAISISVC